MDVEQDSSCANATSGSNLLGLLAVRQSCSALRKAASNARYALKSDLVLVLRIHVEVEALQMIARPTSATQKKQIRR